MSRDTLVLLLLLPSLLLRSKTSFLHLITDVYFWLCSTRQMHSLPCDVLTQAQDKRTPHPIFTRHNSPRPPSPAPDGVPHPSDT